MLVATISWEYDKNTFIVQILEARTMQELTELVCVSLTANNKVKPPTAGDTIRIEYSL